MSIKLQELSNDITIVKHYIKDLSFENLCDINNQDLKTSSEEPHFRFED